LHRYLEKLVRNPLLVDTATGVDLQDVRVEGNLNISDIIVGFTADQTRALIEAATQGADEKVAETGHRLGVTQGAMRTMLATVGETDVPDERLVEKLAEVFEQTRKAAAAIDAVRPENPVAQQHVAKASQAAASGDRDEARRHLRAARVAAEAAAAEARRLAWTADAAAEQQMLQAARAVGAEAELALAALDYAEAARLFGEAASLVPSGEPDEKGCSCVKAPRSIRRNVAETLPRSSCIRPRSSASSAAVDGRRGLVRAHSRECGMVCHR
jgi:hypothetical protein